jgi:uncharacterized membrane protein YphA (DoxX/SURF4 family)
MATFAAASLDAEVPRAQGLLRIVTAFLFLAAAGAGAWAVDTPRAARRA